MNPTTPLYLDDTYLFAESATIISMTALEDGQHDIALDRTIFYPQGGGQPCDHGTIKTASGELSVTKVFLDEYGIIHHIGTLSGSMALGDSVSLAIDTERRILNARNHSAGHLIDIAVIEAGLPDLVATKGHHFADGPYVEFAGEIADSETAMKTLNTILARLISEDIPLQKRILSTEEAVAEWIIAPAGKSARVVNFENKSACGCGGTHVRSTGELQKIEIRKISFKKGMTRVSYALA